MSDDCDFLIDVGKEYMDTYGTPIYYISNEDEARLELKSFLRDPKNLQMVFNCSRSTDQGQPFLYASCGSTTSQIIIRLSSDTTLEGQINEAIQETNKITNNPEQKIPNFRKVTEDGVDYAVVFIPINQPIKDEDITNSKYKYIPLIFLNQMYIKNQTLLYTVSNGFSHNYMDIITKKL
jgi:hypothetical protein